LELLHNTFWLVALEGAMLAINVSEPPTVRVRDVLFRVTPVTATEEPIVTEQVAVLPPLAVVTVTFALPAARPVTKPLCDTDTTAELVLLQVTFWLVALEGAMLAINVSEPPTARVRVVLFRDTPVTGTVLPLTPLSQDAKDKPSTAIKAIHSFAIAKLTILVFEFFIKSPLLLNSYKIKKQESLSCNASQAYPIAATWRLGKPCNSFSEYKYSKSEYKGEFEKVSSI
jgi:hypothetical protein